MTKQIQDAYIVAAKRTPVGKAPRGVFRHTRPDDMLAHVLRETLDECAGIDVNRISDVVIGCAMPEAEQGMNVARIGALLAGLPDTIPGMTINRFCSSGLQSVAIAANTIRLGESDLVLAGGTESMSMVPMMGFHPVMHPEIFKDDNIGIAYGMGITAENVADRWKIGREEQDAFALRSHQRAIAAQDAGNFKEEIAPYPLDDRYPDLRSRGVTEDRRVIENDEGPRRDTSAEALAKLRTVFRRDGTVTAGNSSQMSDGAGAVLLASEQAIKDYGLTPLARFVGFSVAGVPPEIMGIGPKEAIPKALQRTGIKQDQLEWIELNEAFAAQSLAVIKDLGLDPDKVNPEGGAIALGHPLGATGSIRIATLVHGMRRKQQKYGMVTMCIGTGMGAAGIFEMV
ncbi:MAG TPA: acetyl-CoA C-acyltransferase [Rhodanobacteraceae bacterium]|nr:acetyl-CoA C-acyltransferase [Rhodanobacteraceae bacterium]